PRNVKLRGLRDKFILRNFLGERLPDAIRNRPKVAYQAPDMKGFFIDGKAPDYVMELMSEQRIRDVGLFDPGKVRLLMKKAMKHDLDRAGTRDNMAFILVLSTMLLDEMFVRNARNMKSDISIPNDICWV
ncbi:MAG: hypothetical protein KAI73_00450, partial [Rhodospirillaceae bacterium]|nr:hypothetical protein [Rhodospirillaceae bacterium]